MNPKDQELISAYVDNELTETQRASFEERLDKDAEFSAAFQHFLQLDQGIQKRYQAIDNRPLPQGIASLLDLEQDQTPTSKPSSQTGTWLPLAAALVLSVFGANWFLNQAGESDNSLAAMLDSQVSGIRVQLAEGEQLYLSMTFEDNNSNVCREYFLTPQSGASTQAIGCKIEGQWETVVSAQTQFRQVDAVQPSNAVSSPAVEAWLDKNMHSDPFTEQQEKNFIGK